MGAMSTKSPLAPTSNINKNSQREKKKTKRAKRACYHCKKAKTSCSNERPCSRCVRLNLTDTCIDTPRSDINEDEKKLWEQTLQYLTTKTNSKDKDEIKLKQMLVDYAKRASGEPSNQNNQKQTQTIAAAAGEIVSPPPSFLMEPDEYSSDPMAIIQTQNAQVNYLSQQNEYLSQQVESLLRQLEQKRELNKSFYSFSILSTHGDVAYSRWSYPAHSLLDYNRGFLELSQRTPSELQVNRFNIRQLHHEKHIFSCSAALYLLCQGLVEYIEMNQEWWTPKGAVPVKTYLNVNLCEHQHCGEVILFSKRSLVPFPAETLFQPLDIGLSQKAKAQGFNLKEYFALQNHMPSFLADTKVSAPTLCEDGSKPFKLPSNGAKDVGVSKCPENQGLSFSPTGHTAQSSYSHSPPGLPASPISNTIGEIKQLPELGGDSLSFLESLTEENFNDVLGSTVSGNTNSMNGMNGTLDHLNSSFSDFSSSLGSDQLGPIGLDNNTRISLTDSIDALLTTDGETLL